MIRKKNHSFVVCDVNMVYLCVSYLDFKSGGINKI